MKFSNFVFFATSAVLSYQIVKNRQKIKEEIQETTDAFSKIQTDLASIQYNTDIIEEQSEKATKIFQDISYQYKVLENQATKQIDQIKEIWQNYN